MRHRIRRVPAVSGRDGVWLPTGEEAAAFDRAAHSTVPARVLMESAGRAAASVIHRIHPYGRILGFAGGGHNGGDLLVALRTLHSWGRDVTILTIGSRDSDRSLLNGFDLETHRFEDFPRDANADVLVDGLLGTGFEGAPRADAGAAIKVMNQMERPIIALDVPSGVNATTGAVPGAVVHAETTVTFGWPKLGMLLYPARAHCGRILAVDIGFPPPPMEGFGAGAITPGWAIARTPRRAPDAHKGTSGKLLILAGQNGMAGAALIAAEAAVRSGAGLVRVASDRLNRTVVQLGVPETTFIDRTALTEEDVRNATAIVAGPGIGRDPDARAALEVILRHGEGIPTLLDADALNMLAQNAGVLRDAAANRPLLITPHPVELARVLDTDADAILADRISAAREAAQVLGCVVLLKGQPSVVAELALPMLVNTAVTSDVAAAGMGDQLAGVTGGLMAAGVDPRTAAGLALYYGGVAARIARRGRSLSPRDVTGSLSAAFTKPGHTESALRLPFITFDQPAPS